MWLSRLSAPLAYLRIRHRAKRKYDIWIPAAAATAITGAIVCAPAPVNVFADNGLVPAIGGLLQVLTGFYIAALGAIATFDRPGMDRLMLGDPPTLARNGHRLEQLTRRRFLCFMFGYLSLLSLVLYLFGIAVAAAIPSLRLSLSATEFECGRVVAVFIYFLGFSNLGTTTLLGLEYLTDRMHRYEPTLYLEPTPQNGPPRNDGERRVAH